MSAGTASLVAFAPFGPFGDHAVGGAVDVFAGLFLFEVGARESTGRLLVDGAGAGLVAETAGLRAVAVASPVGDGAVRTAFPGVTGLGFRGVLRASLASMLRLGKDHERACALTAFTVSSALRPRASFEKAVNRADWGGSFGGLEGRLGSGGGGGGSGGAYLKGAGLGLLEVFRARLAVQLSSLLDVANTSNLASAASNRARGPFTPVGDNAVESLLIPACKAVVAVLYFITRAV
jgi:hypothetical protein